MTTLSDLRKQLQDARRMLTQAQQRDASARVVKHLMAFLQKQTIQRLALYMPVLQQGELNILPLMDQLPSGIHYYLPVISDQNTLIFRRYHANTPLVANRLQILEPTLSSPAITPETLDVALLPLVGFDSKGHRLGMGHGYYDRTFAFRKHHPAPPLLIGCGHACQSVPDLPVHPWDVPCDFICTPEGWAF